MIARTNYAKTLIKHISNDCKCKFDSAICNWNLKWNNETCQCECKTNRTGKKDYGWNPITYICDNGEYFKSIDDNSVTVCHNWLYFSNCMS